VYAIKRSDGFYLADGAVYTDINLPQPVWQRFEGDRQLYLEESLFYITRRKERIEKIYSKHTLSVEELNEEQLEYLSFRKLRGY
jgi:hypothetical protein